MDQKNSNQGLVFITSPTSFINKQLEHYRNCWSEAWTTWTVHSHLLFEEVLPFDKWAQETLFLLVLQLWVWLLEVFNQVVQRLQHVLNETGNLRRPPLCDAIQSSEGKSTLMELQGQHGPAPLRWVAVWAPCDYLIKLVKRKVVLRMIRAARDSSCWQRCRIRPSSMWPSECRQAWMEYTTQTQKRGQKRWYRNYFSALLLLFQHGLIMIGTCLCVCVDNDF